MTTYRWKTGSMVSVDAAKAGKVCERLSRKGTLTPKALVDASRKPTAPLHGCFEWDDEVAAERYRETQAGYIIRSLEVDVDGVEPVRAFVSVSVEDSGPVYMDVHAAMASPGSRDYVLEAAMAELRAFRRKYESLAELAGVIAAIDAVA